MPHVQNVIFQVPKSFGAFWMSAEVAGEAKLDLRK
jgi:hypothetical protein